MSRRRLGTAPSCATTPDAARRDAAEFAEYLRLEGDRRRAGDADAQGAGRGGMYRRAMMRAYAESIGVDPEAAVTQFQRPAEKPPRSAAAATPQPGGRRIRPAAIAGAAAATAVIAWMAMASFTTRQDAVSLEVTSAAVPREAPVAPIAPPPARTIHSADPAPPASMAATPRAGAPARTAATRAAAPAARATEGLLDVRSEPAGARVTVNGIGWGVTPLTIRHLELGPKRIRLTLQGHVSAERIVHLAPDRPSGSLQVRLRVRPDPSRSPSGRTARDAAARRP